jgi:glycine dehydrogenase subunit 2
VPGRFASPRVIREGALYRLEKDHPDSIGRLHGFHGNFSVLVRAYAYIRTMGPENLKKASQLAVLNANYLKEKLKGDLHLPYDRPCMHECVFSDARQRKQKVTTLDMAKRLIDFGFHPPTIYFPLVVPGAIMIEENPDLLRQAPQRSKLRRLDETAAARKPRLCG